MEIIVRYPGNSHIDSVFEFCAPLVKEIACVTGDQRVTNNQTEAFSQVCGRERRGVGAGAKKLLLWLKEKARGAWFQQFSSQQEQLLANPAGKEG